MFHGGGSVGDDLPCRGVDRMRLGAVVAVDGGPGRPEPISRARGAGSREGRVEAPLDSDDDGRPDRVHPTASRPVEVDRAGPTVSGVELPLVDGFAGLCLSGDSSSSPGRTTLRPRPSAMSRRANDHQREAPVENDHKLTHAMAAHEHADYDLLKIKASVDALAEKYRRRRLFQYSAAGVVIGASLSAVAVLLLIRRSVGSP
jgi:hypothetical protein